MIWYYFICSPPQREDANLRLHGYYVEEANPPSLWQDDNITAPMPEEKDARLETFLNIITEC